MQQWAGWAWQGACNYRAANYIDSRAAAAAAQKKINEMNLNKNKNEIK